MNSEIVNYIKKINEPFLKNFCNKNKENIKSKKNSKIKKKNISESSKYSYKFEILSEQIKNENRIKFKDIDDEQIFIKTDLFNTVYTYLSGSINNILDIKYITLTIITTLIFTIKILYTNLLYK